jgi:DNA-binding Lrp family transcriptional regulator
MARFVKPEKSNIVPNNRASASNAALAVVVEHIKKTSKNGKRKTQSMYDIDEFDMAIINHMLAGYSSTEIAKKTGKPLSTIQRRTRNMLVKGYVIPIMHLNFKKFGLRRGLLHFKVKTADVQEMVQRLSAIKGVESASGYLGSLNVIANVVYADSREVLDIIAEAQKLDHITDVSWSEEIHSVHI